MVPYGCAGEAEGTEAVTKIETGGRAFPRTGEGVGNPRYDEPGMTLRDYFAAQALPAVINHDCPTEGIGTYFDMMAQDAYRFADAMLAERNKQ